jgi:hypothetical protein
MATTITGSLKSLDTKDTFTIHRKPNVFDYTVSASGGGTLRFKVQAYQPPLVGEVGTKGSWVTIRSRIKVDSGKTKTGTFTVPVTKLSSTQDAEKTEVKVILSRGVGTKGVEYDVELKHR